MSEDPYYPLGKKYPDDEGELNIRIAADPHTQCVRIDFTKPIHWLALEAEEATALANLILEKVRQL